MPPRIKSAPALGLWKHAPRRGSGWSGSEAQKVRGKKGHWAVQRAGPRPGSQVNLKGYHWPKGGKVEQEYQSDIQKTEQKTKQKPDRQNLNCHYWSNRYNFLL